MAHTEGRSQPYGSLPLSQEAYNPYAAPPSGFQNQAIGVLGPQAVQQIMAQGMHNIQRVSPVESISQGFRLVFGPHFWPILGVTMLYMLLASAGAVCYVGLITTPIITAGYSLYLLRLLRGQPAEISLLFSPFSISFGHTLAAALISGIFTALGVVCLIIPGIYLAIAYSFCILLTVDKRMHFWDAMEVSRKVITSNWWIIFALMLLSWLVSLGGFLCLIVGVFLAVPVITAAAAHAYDQTFGGGPQPQPLGQLPNDYSK